MIVVDGRTDREKLVELLQHPEETHLEFKSVLDLSTKQDELNFVKDAVSMANRPPGGYILIGVDDEGTPCLATGTIADRSLFDGARLGDTIRKYIEGEIHVISQVHELEEREVVLIYLPHHRDGLPVPMSKLGQFSEATRKPTVVFRPGELLVREGAKNTHIRHAHWNDLLSRRDRWLREEARSQVDTLIADLVTALRSAGSAEPALVPLTDGMAPDAFREAVISHLEADNDVRLRQFLGHATAHFTRAEDRSGALEQITILIAQAMYFEKSLITEMAVNKLFDAYTQLGRGDHAVRLEIVTRVYVLGSLAVRLKQWKVVRSLVLRPYPPNDIGYAYSSWIRHGQVEGSRNELFPKNKGGMMISAARDLMSDEPHLRPDLPDSAIPDPAQLMDNDILLNSLCQFDILYCLIVAAEGQHDGGAYPAASALNQYRADPAFNVVSGDAVARAEMFSKSNKQIIAQALTDVFTTAKEQSYKYGGFWRSLPQGAQQFVDKFQRDTRE